MKTSVATLGILAVTGDLSLCDLCGPATSAATRAAYRARAAFVGPVSAAVTAQARRQDPTVPSTAAHALQGKTCGRCAVGTSAALTRPPSVTKAGVSYTDGPRVPIVSWESARVRDEQTATAVRALRHTATRLQ